MALQTTSPTSATSCPEAEQSASPAFRSRRRKPATGAAVRAGRDRFPAPAQPRGFTLLQLLVVIGILILLAGILFPAVNRANRVAQETKTAADLAMIGVALEAYKSDFGSYPQIDTLANDPTVLPNLGMAVLAKSLLAPGNKTAVWTSPVYTSPYQPGSVVRVGLNEYVCLIETNSGPPTIDWVQFSTIDGNDGTGFRARLTGGPVKGPYLQPDKVKSVGMSLHTATGPILYFPSSPLKPTVSSPAGFVATTGTGQRLSLFNADDNIRAFRRGGEADNVPAYRRIATLLGDSNYNGQLDPTETARVSAGYILWAPGADGRFGPDDPTRVDQVKSCDDIISPQP